MEKTIILVLIDGRKKQAVHVQQILTEWGCLIKTRLGIHDGVLDNCSDAGLLMLEMVGDIEKIRNMQKLLSNLPGVSANLVTMSV
ncbi:MAG: hypothetical protein WC002_00195 [Candidatus Muiribacteriota bacterium]|jgi:hypothetical protein